MNNFSSAEICRVLAGLIETHNLEKFARVADADRKSEKR
jgi:hypothetical protein